MSDLQRHSEICCCSLEVLLNSKFSGFNEHELTGAPLPHNTGDLAGEATVIMEIIQFTIEHGPSLFAKGISKMPHG